MEGFSQYINHSSELWSRSGFISETVNKHIAKTRTVALSETDNRSRNNLGPHRASSVAAMAANGLNLFLLILSIIEILLLQIGYVRSAQKKSSENAGRKPNTSA